ncbi:MAG: 4Fe-4S binding protein [Chloroflexi bacterium]|nr:4Fe-4S binding protein [Chloroflexota bacterium]
MSLVVDKRICPQNHPCPILRVCPTEAMTQRGYAAPEIDAAKCRECGKCLRYCPTGAVRQL